MILRAFFAVVVSLSLLACGVKSELEPPNGAQPEKQRVDPSKPPQPLGQ